MSQGEKRLCLKLTQYSHPLLQPLRCRVQIGTATYVIALQLAIEGGPTDTEHFSGDNFVAFHLLKNPLDRRPFDIFKIGRR